MSVIWNERRIRSVRLALEQDAEALFDQALAFAFAWHRSPWAVTQWRRGRAALLRCRKCPAPSSSRERVIVQAAERKSACRLVRQSPRPTHPRRLIPRRRHSPAGGSSRLGVRDGPRCSARRRAPRRSGASRARQGLRSHGQRQPDRSKGRPRAWRRC